MDCAACGTPLRPMDHFCRKCGAPVAQGASTLPASRGPTTDGGTWTCAACGAETPDDRRFCQICGTPEPPAANATMMAPSTSQAQTLTSPAPEASAAPSAAGVCAHCASPLVPDSQFCNTCGAPLPIADERLSCAACGQDLPQGAAFCNVCGAAAPPSLLPPTDPDDGAPGGGGRSAKKLVLIGVIAVLVIAALAVAGVMFLPDLLDSGPEPPTLTEQVTTVMGPVVTTNGEFRTAVKAIRPNGPNVVSQTSQRLRVCEQKGRELRLALHDATAKLTAPPVDGAPVETAGETAAKQALLTAFKANKAFVQSIQSLPDPSGSPRAWSANVARPRPTQSAPTRMPRPSSRRCNRRTRSPAWR
jgi:predicted amidophosphoribosyltransferase